MSTGSAENQPKTSTTSNERQPEPLVESAPESAPPPIAPPSAPPPAVGPHQGYNAQAPYWQQQQPYAPPANAPHYPAGQPYAMSQPIRQRSGQASDTFCCCDSKTAVKVFATIMLILYVLNTILTAGTWTLNIVACAVSSVLTLIMILDVVNAYCVQNSYWYLTSSIIWGICAGLKTAGLVVITILATFYADTYVDVGIDARQYWLAGLVGIWLIMVPDITLLVFYTMALCKASNADKQQLQGKVIQSQPQYAPLPQYAQEPPMRPQNANHPQQYRV